jgi:hypothetical protein
MVLTFARWERSLRFLGPTGFSQLLWKWTINLLQKRTFLFVANRCLLEIWRNKIRIVPHFKNKTQMGYCCIKLQNVLFSILPL